MLLQVKSGDAPLGRFAIRAKKDGYGDKVNRPALVFCRHMLFDCVFRSI